MLYQEHIFYIIHVPGYMCFGVYLIRQSLFYFSVFGRWQNVDNFVFMLLIFFYGWRRLKKGYHSRYINDFSLCYQV